MKESGKDIGASQLSLLREKNPLPLIDPPVKARPFLKWAGGKAKLLPELLKRVPNHYKNYFEPFLGGGALFFELAPRHAFLSDINDDLINAYRVVRRNLKPLLQDLERHVYSAEYFYEVRNMDRLPEFKSWSAIKRASRLIYLNKSCYNGLYRVNSNGFFNTPFGEYTNPRIIDRENLIACSQLLKEATLACGPFRVFEQQMRKGDFVYFDPPYVPRNSTSNFRSYSKDGFAENMQTALRDLCLRLTKKGVLVMVSNSHTEFIIDAYRNFNIDVVEAPRFINSKAENRGNVEEVIIRNY